MNVSELTSLIGSLGFPIVMCFLMSYYIITNMSRFAQIAQSVESTVQDNQDILEEVEKILIQIESNK